MRSPRSLAILLAAAAALILLAAVMSIMSTTTWAKQEKEIVGVTPNQVRWYTPPYYKDGRQRAQMYGDSNQRGPWVDRVKLPGGMRIPAHTHPHDELITVIEGTWYLGEGDTFDSARLRGYPAGSFIVIPAGVPHFVATEGGSVIVQVYGTGKFGTDFVKK